MENHKKAGQSHEHATNLTSIELVQAAEAHGRAFLVNLGFEKTKSLGLSGPLTKSIHELIELFALEACNKSLSDLLRVSYPF